jgi:hypothetical protein
MVNENDKATIEWLNSQKPNTRKSYKTYMNYFLQFVNLTGDQILADRKTDTEHNWEKKVIAYKQWMISDKRMSGYTATAAAMAIRGFFAFHYSKLEYRPTEQKRLSQRTRRYEDYRFSIEDLKRMFDIGNLAEKYVLLVGKSFGLRAGDFLKLKRGDIEPYIDRPVPISIGELGTEKEAVKAYPFIDSDALPVIRLMLQKMDREGRTKPADRFLTFKDEIQLSRVVKRLTQKAGINTGDKVVRFHNLRKFLIDHLASYMSESKWKQIVGKQISEGAYVSADSLRDDYAKAMGETTFSKVVGEEDLKLKVEAETLKTLAKLRGLSEGDITKIFRKKAIKPEDIRSEIEVLKELVGKKETQHDGADCGEQFEQIAETQLLSYLKAGWSIVKELANGDIIVKR